MRTVVCWNIEHRGLAVEMTRQCGCEVLWNSPARVDDEWVIYPCFRHSGIKQEEEDIRQKIVEESRALQFEI